MLKKKFITRIPEIMFLVSFPPLLTGVVLGSVVMVQVRVQISFGAA
jgi:hypothetical protein